MVLGQVDLLAVSLATVPLESALYGIFFVLTISSVYSLRRRHRSSHAKKSVLFTPMFIATILLSLLVSGHWILECVRLFDAFIYFAGGTAPLAIFGNLSLTTEVVKTAFLMATLCVGDAVLIYRLWTIWGQNIYVTILPLCSLAGLTVTAVGIPYTFSQYVSGEDVFTSGAGHWIRSAWVFSAATNWYGTVMITWRIWLINQETIKYGGSSLTSVLAIIVESAAIYTVWSTFFFGSYESQSNLQFIVIDCWPVITGITFMLIITRVGLGWAQKATTFASTTRQGSELVIRSPGNRGPASATSYPMKPMEINISRAVNDDKGGSFGAGEHGEGLESFTKV